MTSIHRTARCAAQAKINLFLRVLAREASGYHQLETMFQRLELADDVVVRVGVAGRSLDCDVDVGPVEHNLAWRAAVAYADATRWPDGFAIEVGKHIPVGGGLGGGSADAGAVLRALNALAPEPLGRSDLLAFAGALGADVPFLATELPRALAWGRGERMLALDPLPVRAVHLATFGEGVSTAAAFEAHAARSRPATGPRPIVWDLERVARWDDVALIATNDFEPVVFASRPDIAEMRELFADVARQVDAEVQEGDGDDVPFSLMTGSGATVFLASPERIGLSFDVRSTDDAVADDGLRIVATRTAERVAPVEIED